MLTMQRYVKFAGTQDTTPETLYSNMPTGKVNLGNKDELETTKHRRHTSSIE